MPPSAYKVLKAFAEKKKIQRQHASARRKKAATKEQQRRHRRGSSWIVVDHNGFSIQLTGRSTITVLIIHGGTHPHQSTNLGKHSNGTSGTSTQRTFPCLVQNLAPCFLMSRVEKIYKNTKISQDKERNGPSISTKETKENTTKPKQNTRQTQRCAFHPPHSCLGANTYLFRGRRFDMMLFSVFLFMMI